MKLTLTQYSFCWCRDVGDLDANEAEPAGDNIELLLIIWNMVWTALGIMPNSSTFALFPLTVKVLPEP